MKNVINRALVAKKKLFILFLALAASAGSLFAETIFSESFSSSQGNFTIVNKTLPSGCSYVWKWKSADYGIVASAYKNNTNYATESWLISPSISLANYYSEATLCFDHACNKGVPDNLRVKISKDNGVNWHDLNISQWPAGTNWTFLSATASLNAYVGKTIKIAFCYVSTTTICPQWEIKNFQITGVFPSNTNLYYNFNSSQKTAEVTMMPSGKYAGEITIPSSVSKYSVTYSVTSIGSYAFSDCPGLTSVIIPNSVTSIGEEAFYGCTGLTSITIPNSVTSIGSSAFNNCTGLTSVIVGSGVPASMGGVFSGCNKITSITINSDALLNRQYGPGDGYPNICSYFGSKVSECIIGDSVKGIGGWAFNNSTKLKKVIIGNNVKSIGQCAFTGCFGLSSIVISNSVTSIGSQAFRTCTGLTSIEIPNSVTSIGWGAFEGCSGLTSVTIGNSVTSIGEDAFKGCGGLTSVTIPNSVTSIGKEAFYGCDGLTSVTIPNSVTSIGAAAFGGCTGLTSVTIPNSVTSIGASAFWGCSGLTSVTIGNSVTSIGEYAFDDCTGLTSITCKAITPPTLGSFVFDNVNKSIPLYVPAGSMDLYKSAYQWKDFSNILPIGAQPADVTTTIVTPSATTADIAWPQVTGAATYTIEIKKNGELICTLTFNAQGQLISITFAAPSRNNAPQQTQAAGFAFTVTSLDSGTTYSYTMTAKDSSGNVLKTESGSFTTTSDAQGFEDVQGNNVQCTKIVHNGQIFILRGEHVYDTEGKMVR